MYSKVWTKIPYYVLYMYEYVHCTLDMSRIVIFFFSIFFCKEKIGQFQTVYIAKFQSNPIFMILLSQFTL